MAEDPLSKFTARHSPRPPAAPVARSAAPLAPALVVNHDLDGREVYEAFDNKVRAMNVEIRCHRSGISYSLPYAHLGGIVFNFRTGRELMFTACGYAVPLPAGTCAIY